MSLEEIKEDIKDIRSWQRSHDERHGDDANMLGRVLDDIKAHTANHHGKLSQARQAAIPVGLIGLLAAVIELVRQFLV